MVRLGMFVAVKFRMVCCPVCYQWMWRLRHTNMQLHVLFIWVWSLVSNIKRGRTLLSTNDWTQEGVCNRRTENVANDELHNVFHLSCIGSLKNSFKAHIAFILRHTIMKFVVKCSAIQNFLFPALYASMVACGSKFVFQIHLHLLSSTVL
jgi:hypothetical protein